MFLLVKNRYFVVIQNAKDGVQIQVYNIIYESVYHSSQFILVEVKKAQAQLRLRQNYGLLIKKRVSKLGFDWILNRQSRIGFQT